MPSYNQVQEGVTEEAKLDKAKSMAEIGDPQLIYQAQKNEADTFQILFDQAKIQDAN